MAIMEFEFSILGFEKDKYGISLIDILLEG
jgi:hypothetical protein